jgi:hypothetical protein
MINDQTAIIRQIWRNSLFRLHILGRIIMQEISLTGYDGITIPPGFNSEKPVDRWFIYDLNVSGDSARLGQTLAFLIFLVKTFVYGGIKDWFLRVMGLWEILNS